MGIAIQRKLERLFVKPRESTVPATTFRVRIKLSSQEAVQRLNKIRQSLVSSQKKIIYLCQTMRRAPALQRALVAADVELLSALDTLQSFEMGERSYLGDVVLHIEARANETIVLLSKIRRACYGSRAFWGLLHHQGQQLAIRIEESFQKLEDMTAMINSEIQVALLQPKPKLTLQARIVSWVVGWVWVSEQDKMARKVSAWRPKEQHFERFHLFGNDKGSGKPCVCLDYR